MVVTLHCHLPDEIPTSEVGWNVDTRREDELLERFIRANWNISDPDRDAIGWGYAYQQMDRARSVGKNITLHCYAVPGTSRMQFVDTAGLVYEYEVRIRIDVGLRDITASSGGAGTTGTGIAKRPVKLTNIDKFLQQLISVNAAGLQNNGINEISVLGYPEFVTEVMEGGNDVVMFHYVLTVLAHYQKVIDGNPDEPQVIDTTPSTSINRFATPIALKYVTDDNLLVNDPSSQFTLLYVKPIDQYNDGLFLRLKKNDGFVDLQLA